jgi:hypothetical protein
VWLEGDGARLSTLDLFGRGFALLVAGDAAHWRRLVDPAATFAGFDIEVFGIGDAEGYRDVDGGFPSTYGLAPGEAVLVRPDGVCAWRSVDPAGLDAAVASVLARG